MPVHEGPKLKRKRATASRRAAKCRQDRRLFGFINFDDKQEFIEQLKLGVPFVFAALLVLKDARHVGFAGRLGQDYLAAVGFALAPWKITGRDLVLSLTERSTLQTQAWCQL